MIKTSCLSRRDFLVRSGTAGVGLASAAGLGLLPACSQAAEPVPDWSVTVGKIVDPEIRAGVEAAIVKNLLPAAREDLYPGYFMICADGVGYGNNSTWPALDSWQMAGAYLLLGRTRLVCDYFDFVQASQRKDGHIPFSIYLSPSNGPKTFTYKPPKREGLPASSQITRAWLGVFDHWRPKEDPISTLGPVCYILTAAEIFDATNSVPWLREKLPSVELTAKYLLGRKNKNGLIDKSGFYIEQPARYQWDGVAQCYVIHAFREMARLFRAVGDKTKRDRVVRPCGQLTQDFIAAFWRQDHFGEYVHPERGLVDSHGLSDVNWAAIAFGVAAGRNLELLWPRLFKERGFWLGDMPTQIVTNPFNYEKWELDEPTKPPSPLQDLAAMGRVWYLEATACRRMHANDRLVESTRKVCRAAKADGYWRERYFPRPNGTVSPGGAAKYCEYPAILVRVVFGNRKVFFR